MSKRGSVIVLAQDLVKSNVWLSLSGTAKGVYLLFRTKCQFAQAPGKPGKRGMIIANNGEIVFTYAEARSRYKITASRFRRALDELVHKGFIDVEATGMGVHKVSTLYAISERWRQYGSPDFSEAERPEPSISNPGFRPNNRLWQRARKKKSSVESAHGAVCESAHGDILAVCESEHGE